ncbi:hypothetical protein Cop2CBH44_30590 [Coprobacter secundus subsp. similis]|uniref:Uncharacterized protein n=1 Tax=Coprobacter secundus subsp. similis TaxID=2751153 RepID=A0A7G1HYH0_9BACT|nr:hypothetical protein Cop2CBH44_30590 [Coprobacter secundus subsp. similis]
MFIFALIEVVKEYISVTKKHITLLLVKTL